MAESLTTLEAQRATIQHQISRLGDMRSGSISTTGGRCGNPRCRCHREDDSGHGPFYRLTRKVNGKTMTETFPNASALRKAEREVAEYVRRQLNFPAVLPQENMLPKRGCHCMPHVRHAVTNGLDSEVISGYAGAN